MMPSSLTEIGETHFSNKPPYYLHVYERYFAPLRHQPLRILELGVFRGGSLETWAAYFPNASVTGLDQQDVREVDADGELLRENGQPVGKRWSTDRIRFYQGEQDDAALLRRISSERAPAGWDIVIDDCSHIGTLTAATFHCLWPLTRQYGHYILEDWGVGYMPGFRDGQALDPAKHLSHDGNHFPSHDVGMPGFMKQLVDEVGIADARASNDQLPEHSVEFLHIYRGVGVMQKR